MACISQIRNSRNIAPRTSRSHALHSYIISNSMRLTGTCIVEHTTHHNNNKLNIKPLVFYMDVECIILTKHMLQALLSQNQEIQYEMYRYYRFKYVNFIILNADNSCSLTFSNSQLNANSTLTSHGHRVVQSWRWHAPKQSQFNHVPM
jgi:hypothetical protein